MNNYRIVTNGNKFAVQYPSQFPVGFWGSRTETRWQLVDSSGYTDSGSPAYYETKEQAELAIKNFNSMGCWQPV